MWLGRGGCSGPGASRSLRIFPHFFLTPPPSTRSLASEAGLGPHLTWSPWHSRKSTSGDREPPVLPAGLVLRKQPNSGDGSSFMARLPAGKTNQSQVSSEIAPNRSPALRASSPTKPLYDLEPVIPLLASVSLSAKWESWTGCCERTLSVLCSEARGASYAPDRGKRRETNQSDVRNRAGLTPTLPSLGWVGGYS